MPTSRPSLADALRAPGELKRILPLLCADAARRLYRARLAAGRDHAPAIAEVLNIVHNALASCLVGARVWPTNMTLERAVMAVMWSQMGHLCDDIRRRAEESLDVLDEAPSPASQADIKAAQHAALAAIAAVVKGDLELEQYHAAVVDGAHKRVDVADVLGWTAERVSLVRLKLNRRLNEAGLSYGDTDR